MPKPKFTSEQAREAGKKSKRGKAKRTILRELLGKNPEKIEDIEKGLLQIAVEMVDSSVKSDRKFVLKELKNVVWSTKSQLDIDLPELKVVDLTDENFQLPKP